MNPRIRLAPFSPWSFDRLYYTCLMLLVSVRNTVAQTPTIRFLKAGGTGNGGRWVNASGDLQAMINASTSGDQVGVAAGIYEPTSTGVTGGVLSVSGVGTRLDNNIDADKVEYLQQ